ncbi:MAG: thioesterase domain-containing protein, partial [Acidobacteriota bacterium]
ALPLTRHGKVDRSALPSPEAALRRERPSVPPRDRFELELVQVFEELLGVRPVGPRDDFFRLGGHSLLAVRLVAELRRRFGRELPLAQLFTDATVEGLASWLRREDLAGSGVEEGVLVPLSPDAASRPPLFVVHPIGGHLFGYAELASRLSPDVSVAGLQTPAGVELATLESMAEHYLAAVTERQGGGPYRLAGWSMGGVVAYEMARQLRESGEAVAFLGLVDAAVPGGERPVGEAELRSSFVRDLAALAGADDLRPAELEGAEEDGFLEDLLRLGREADVLPGDVTIEDIRRLYRTFRLNARLLTAYRPKPLEGPLTLFRAADGGARPADLGWRRLAPELQVVEIPGNHYSLLRGAGARVLAGALRQALGGR